MTPIVIQRLILMSVEYYLRPTHLFTDKSQQKYRVDESGIFENNIFLGFTENKL